MTFRVYIADLNAYNAGIIKGEWVSLPMDSDELQEVVMRHTNGGQTDYAIHDYESDLELRIGGHKNVFELNDLAERMASLEDWELEAIGAYLESTGDTLEEALSCIEAGDYSVYEAKDEEELGYYIVEEGFFGVKVPEALQVYLDYEAIGRDFVVTSGGTFYGDFYYEFY